MRTQRHRRCGAPGLYCNTDRRLILRRARRKRNSTARRGAAVASNFSELRVHKLASARARVSLKRILVCFDESQSKPSRHFLLNAFAHFEYAN